MYDYKLKSIVYAGENRYTVLFASDDGSEISVTCKLSETSWGSTVMSPVGEPDIFMLGYADPMSTTRALIDFRDGKGS